MSARYATLERIAVGGMGEVFLARQEGLGGFQRTVVLKRLLPDVEGDDDSVKRFLDEARVAAALSHENVVSIIEVGNDGAPFLALEYVHGENAAILRTRARRMQVPIPVVVAARIIADAARGLAHAHDARDVHGRPLRIVHRDVAPKNIFVRSDGVSKIGDFGIAKSDHKFSRTATGQVPGTLSYMSPEQARGDNVDARSDQFSLGIVFWELLTGELLFRAHSPEQTLRNLVAKKVVRPSRYRSDAEPLDAIARRMLERDPKKRYATLADAAAAIEAALPETRADVGQRAVAAFVEMVVGEELRDRMQRIERGPELTEIVASDDDPTSSETPVTNGELNATTPARPGLVATRVERPAQRHGRRLLPVAAALSLATALSIGIGLTRVDTPADRTLEYLEEARTKNPLVHRAVFLSMADMAKIDRARSEPVADVLVELLEQRFDMLLADARNPKADRRVLAEEERALEAAAKNALAPLGEPFATEALDMWDYDAGAPTRWMAPDPPTIIRRDLQDGYWEFLKSQVELRARAVDQLVGKNAKAHAILKPLVNEHEELVERSLKMRDDELLATYRRAAQIVQTAERELAPVIGPMLASAVASVGFANVPSPDEWQPLHAMPPSTREKKAQGEGVPQMH